MVVGARVGPKNLPWAEEMRQRFRAGSTSQFILYGSIHDVVPLPAGEDGARRYVSLPAFLTEVMFAPFDPGRPLIVTASVLMARRAARS